MKSVKKAGLLFFICTLTSYVTPRVSVASFDDLQKETALKTNDTLYVVNFWATWCEPCVKELPAFQAAYKKFSSRKVKMIYVSMNSAKEIATVEKFVEEKDLKPEVLLLGTNNPNAWIDKVDSSWGGSIPATVMYRHGKKLYFHEGDFTSDKLNSLIQSKLK
jgi:thiol-disulfide isomerase/thioredoxin